MSMRIACPNCQREAQVSPAHAGKMRKCTGCGSMFRIGAAAGVGGASVPLASAPSDELGFADDPEFAAPSPSRAAAPKGGGSSQVPSQPVESLSSGYEYRPPLATSAASDTPYVPPSTLYPSGSYSMTGGGPLPLDSMPNASIPIGSMASAIPTSASTADPPKKKKRTRSRKSVEHTTIGTVLGVLLALLAGYARLSRHWKNDTNTRANRPAVSSPNILVVPEDDPSRYRRRLPGEPGGLGFRPFP